MFDIAIIILLIFNIFFAKNTHWSQKKKLAQLLNVNLCVI